jgi:hypothetical protein
VSRAPQEPFHVTHLRITSTASSITLPSRSRRGTLGPTRRSVIDQWSGSLAFGRVEHRVAQARGLWWHRGTIRGWPTGWSVTRGACGLGAGRTRCGLVNNITTTSSPMWRVGFATLVGAESTFWNLGSRSQGDEFDKDFGGGFKSGARLDEPEEHFFFLL